MNYSNALTIVSLALKPNEEILSYNREEFLAIDWQELYSLFNEHATIPLFLGLNQYMPENIRTVWKQSTYSNIYNFSHIEKQQDRILTIFQSYGICRGGWEA